MKGGDKECGILSKGQKEGEQMKREDQERKSISEKVMRRERTVMTRNMREEEEKGKKKRRRRQRRKERKEKKEREKIKREKEKERERTTNKQKRKKKGERKKRKEGESECKCVITRLVRWNLLECLGCCSVVFGRRGVRSDLWL